MDFSIDEDVISLRDLAAEILADQSTPQHLSALDDEGVWFDTRTYSLLAEAGVLGALLPEDVGGAGMGPLGAHQVLEQIGYRVAQVPLWESLAVGGAILARHGDPEQQARLIPGLIDGGVVMTVGLHEAAGTHHRHPRCSATPTETPGVWTLSGAKTHVPFARQAQQILVSATTDAGAIGVFLLDPSSPGVTIEDQVSVSRRPIGLVTLHEARAEILGELDGVLDDLLIHAETGLAAMQLGNCDAALRTAVEYTSQRHQFGQPISSFQAVRQRLADCWTDVQAMRLTSLQASWALHECGDPAESDRAGAIAKFWAADAGHRVLSAAQHVHGGIGIDLDYGLHRHFRLGKHIEFTLGSASDQLRRIGHRYATSA
ncbi:hypothetical protein BHE97_08760 [Aeromicrobium sp. PE09-221]|uniref:acyl-CoA dehydrogenase family protein n=1 Tax=Aeromicrobium sp. PE09-221 TaxID=1898043 RepID=UPI000B3E6C88|nr:acyl-CoA dehydrogenase family protein [Aeromicrobium sp. PE09-221]OUZ10136.1 hypothetical protein BHE97_08760 [Aeromicrobium sp. PE09-221]